MELSTHTDIPDRVLQGGVAAFKLVSNELKQVTEVIGEQLAHCPQENGIGRLIGCLSTSVGINDSACTGFVVLSPCAW